MLLYTNYTTNSLEMYEKINTKENQAERDDSTRGLIICYFLPKEIWIS